MRSIAAVLTLFLFAPYSWAQSEAPMAFHHGGSPNTQAGHHKVWIQATGKIVETTPEDLARYLNSQEYNPRLIRLNSGGGDLEAGLRLGRFLRSEGFDTMVGGDVVEEHLYDNVYVTRPVAGKCISACAYAFFGGSSRFIDSESMLGVHRFFAEGATRRLNDELFSALLIDETQKVMGNIVGYLDEMGVNPEIVREINSAGPKSVYYLTSEDLERSGGSLDELSWLPWDMTAAEDGTLFAISHRRDRRAWMKLVCRSDGLHFELFEAESGDSDFSRADWYDQCATGSHNDKNAHVLLGIAVPPEDYRVVRQGDASGIDFRLGYQPPAIEEPDLFGPRKVYIGACTSRSNALAGTIDGMARNFRAVNRLCGLD